MDDKNSFKFLLPAILTVHETAPMATHSSTADAHGQHGKKEGHEQSAKSAGKILGLPKRLAFLGAGLSGGILLLALVCWWLFPGESTEAIHLANAVKLLEEGHFEEATELLQPLIESQFLDDEAPGRMAYAQGLLGYQEARNSEKEMELPRLASAIAFLRDAQSREPEIRKNPTWQNAMAQSLYRTGAIEEARPWLVQLSTIENSFQPQSVDTLCALDLSLVDINRVAPPAPAPAPEVHSSQPHAADAHSQEPHADSHDSHASEKSHSHEPAAAGHSKAHPPAAKTKPASDHGTGHGTGHSEKHSPNEPEGHGHSKHDGHSDSGGHGHSAGHGDDAAEAEPEEPPFIDPYASLPMLEGDLKRLANLLEGQKLSPEDRTMLLLRRADVLLALERTLEAEAAMQLARNSSTDPDGLAIQEARLAMAKRKFADAEKHLLPLTEGKRPNLRHVSTALYLLARCALEQSSAESALNEQLALRGQGMKRLRDLLVRFVGTEEAVVGMLDMADIHRLEGNTERAIELYIGAVRTIVRLEDYHNRWLSQTAFRDRLRNAWKLWVEGGKYAEALALAESLPPLFDRVETAELVANTTRAWAMTQQEEYDQLPESLKPPKLAQVRSRWKASARAWYQLAQTRKMNFRYPEDLWESSSDSIAAADYKSALERVDEYLATLPREMLATALVRKAGLMMDLDRLDEAIPILESVQQKFPSDPSSYKAQVRLAKAFTEKGDLFRAETQWRAILASETLTPEASEWNEALLKLGCLLVDRGILLRQEADKKGAKGNSPTPAQTVSVSSNASDLPGTYIPDAGIDSIRAVQIEASSRLTEFLARYPNDPSEVQAMYQLARSQREQARLIRNALKSPLAEAVKLRLAEQQKILDEQSLDNLVKLRDTLNKQANQTGLNTLHEAILANTAFDVGHQLFELRRDKDAIMAYNTAINRYRNNPQVLSAFLQMAEAYRRMGKPAEARSMLEQGRVILRQKQIPDSAFDNLGSSLTREEWELWLEKISQLGH
ncbi:Tetratricopeptide TPR_4 [Planctopirus limnophila DSM 3776]|uniref:Tetratricopeptide TPR_4 n=2 Tax=Planctopirus limnophila TaxID=120 RepID=D5SV42_PLAL2|nr:Tetratricopeptide TPR_4 [Planctopirus limnophila DSM 3776]